jgi:hypothetical protein
VQRRARLTAEFLQQTHGRALSTELVHVVEDEREFSV